MNKKKLILIPALVLALTSCGPTSTPTDPSIDPTNPSTEPSVEPSTEPSTEPSVEAPVVTGVTITNKEALGAEWFVGDEDRNVNYTVSYSDGSSKARGATLSTDNEAVCSLPGGAKIHAAGKGTATITVTAGDFTDTVTVNVSELQKKKQLQSQNF